MRLLRRWCRWMLRLLRQRRQVLQLLMCLLGSQCPFGGEGLFSIVQAPLHLPELCCCLQLCGVRRGLPVAESAHPRGKVVDALLVWRRLAGVVRLCPRLLLASCFLASGVLHLLECDVMWGCPHVVGGIVHGCRGISGGRDALRRVYRRCQLC